MGTTTFEGQRLSESRMPELGTYGSKGAGSCYAPKLPKKKRIILIAIIGLMLVSLPIIAHAIPLAVNYSFDQDTYEVNSEVTLNYTIAGGTAPYSNIHYACYSYDNNFLIHITDGNLTDTSGTIVYTPRIGQSTHVLFTFNDADGRYYSNNLGSVILEQEPENVIADGTWGDNLSWKINSAGRLTIWGSGLMKDYQEWYSNECWLQLRSQIREVIIQDGVSSIGKYAFCGCTNLKSVSLPNSLILLGYGTFYDCTMLTNIILPTSIESIGSDAFFNCQNLTGIVLPNSLSCIENSSFEGCSSLSTISIPKTVTTIGVRAFYQCSKLHSVYLQEGVKTIHNGAFAECSVLESISIPGSVETISPGAFTYSNKLTCFYVAPNNTKYTSNNGLLLNKPEEEVLLCCGGYKGKCIIPEGVKRIGANAFYGCRYITDFDFPESLTSIGEYAFGCCDSVMSLTIPNNVFSIEANAFAMMMNLQNIKLPRNLKQIEFGTLQACPNLAFVEIPDGVLSIGGYAFAYCQRLEKVLIPKSVHSFGDEIFYIEPGEYDPEHVPINYTVYCYEFSDADYWAIDNDIPVQYLDKIDMR